MKQSYLREGINRLISEHPGKTVGAFLGLVIAVSFLTLGLWRTLLIGFMIGIGYAIGKWTDDEGKGFRDFLDEKLPRRPYFH